MALVVPYPFSPPFPHTRKSQFFYWVIPLPFFMEKTTEIVIQGYGASVRKKANRFLISSDGEEHEYASGRICQILITGSCSVTSGALCLASEEGIDVVICAPNGSPSCRLMPCHGEGIPELWRKQIALALKPEAYDIVARIIRAKIIHMGTLIQAVGKKKNNLQVVEKGGAILTLLAKLDKGGALILPADAIRGIEGEASRLYFTALSEIVPPPLYLGHRSRHPAKDSLNAYLNYGYGMLYNELEKACILAGLEPHAGFLHADRYGHLSLVYDLIEQFRQPVVDRVALTLALQGQMSSGDIDSRGYLSNDAKRRIVVALFSRLDDKRSIAGQSTTLREAIRENVKSLAAAIKTGVPYTPFQWVWA